VLNYASCLPKGDATNTIQDFTSKITRKTLNGRGDSLTHGKLWGENSGFSYTKWGSEVIRDENLINNNNKRG